MQFFDVVQYLIRRFGIRINLYLHLLQPEKEKEEYQHLRHGTGVQYGRFDLHQKLIRDINFVVLIDNHYYEEADEDDHH